VAQFFTQSTELRENKGETLAHYCGTQYGANRLCTADGKIPLRNHSLFVVKRLAMDGVTLAGAHPLEIKGKFVHLTLQQWNAQFKLVHETDAAKMAKRAATAANQHGTVKFAAPHTHPDCYLIPDFHTEPTSERNRLRTNSVFDVRGDAVIIGDVMLGLVWDGDVVGMVLRVPRTILVESKHYEYQDAAANYYDVPSVPSNHWAEIDRQGRWETSQSLQNKCYRAVGFVRIVLGDDESQPQFDDPFFLVMLEVPEDADPLNPGFKDDCDVFFVPRHESGQFSLLVSDLPSAHAINHFRAFNRDHSRWMQVCSVKPWLFCVKLCDRLPSLHLDHVENIESHVAIHMFHVAMYHIHVDNIESHVTT